MNGDNELNSSAPYWPDGAPVPSLANNVAALRYLGTELSFDLRAQRTVIKDGVKWRPLNERDRVALRAAISARWYDPGKTLLDDAVKQVAFAQQFDPVEQYFARQQRKWDKKKRLRNWLSSCVGIEDTPLTRWLGIAMLVAAVRRTRKPGCRWDIVLFLIGPQGAAKGKVVRTLARKEQWFSDQDVLAASAREQVEMFVGALIVELSEGGGIDRASIEKAKSTISRRADRYHPPYARNVEIIPRRFIFIGTGNDEQFLRDTTGNRRYIPLRVGKIKLNALKRDIDQLWGEAAALEAAGHSITMPKELRPEAAKLQERALETDPWVDALAPLNGILVGDEERISYAMAFQHVGIHVAGQNTSNLARLSVCMVANGWRRSTSPFKLNGGTVRGFRRPRE